MSQIQHTLGYPVITGKPDSARPPGNVQGGAQTGASFQELLEQKLQQQESSQLTFSRHAQERSAERNIALSQTDLDRLTQAVDKAGDKGLRDTLVVMDSTAFIVNIPNRVVVTLVDSGETATTIFTNIDGAVII